MILGDFSTMVHLGIGLHAGTALLQSVFDLAGTPMANRVGRLAELAEAKTGRDGAFQEQVDAAHDILGDLESNRILLQGEFRSSVLVNGGVALALIALLIFISFDSSEVIAWPYGVLFTVLCFGPAGYSLTTLCRSWRKKMAPLRSSIEKLEKALLTPGAR
jgi:hypothetical protein